MSFLELHVIFMGLKNVIASIFDKNTKTSGVGETMCDLPHYIGCLRVLASVFRFTMLAQVLRKFCKTSILRQVCGFRINLEKKDR